MTQPLIAWVKATASGNELRTVAVETDGSVVDSSPRLFAGRDRRRNPLAGIARGWPGVFMPLTLPASRSQRESVGCGTPADADSATALRAPGPVIF